MSNAFISQLTCTAATHRGGESVLPDRPLRVSRFDAVSSLLMAVMILLATWVLMLWVVWMIDRPTQSAAATHPPIKRVSLLAADRVDVARGESGALGHPPAFGQPSEQEVQRLLEPLILNDLAAVNELARRVVATFGSASGPTEPSIIPGDGGMGDGRRPGPSGGPAGEIPRCERWELNFTASGLEQYVRQLDAHGIELGVVGGSIAGVDYLGDWAFFRRAGKSEAETDPRTRHGDSSAERRLYFLWNRPSPLMRFDRQLLTRSKIKLEGRQVIKFISQSLENELAEIELEYARSNGHPDVSEIAKTVFLSENGVSASESVVSPSDDSGDRFHFRVVGQRYRTPRT